MEFRFAIIGAGLTGTSMMYQFVRRLERRARTGALDPRRVHIRIFDEKSVAGPGFPHSEHFVQPYHITNMCADEMSLMYSLPGDFSDWIANRKSELADRFPDLREIIQDPAYHQNSCNHYPRALMGEYLKARFRDAVDTARNLGTKVAVHTDCEVRNIAGDERAVNIHEQDHGRGAALRFTADQVLLATGHWPRSGSGRGYFATPWPAHRLLEEIPKGSDVAVIGSSLTAIETALTLTSDGKFTRCKSGELIFRPSPDTRRVTMLSRHGILPSVRARTIDYRPRFLNRKNLQDLLESHSGSLTLETIFYLLDRELTAATGRQIDWGRIVSPEMTPMELLQESLQQARSASNRCDEVSWQSVLRPLLPFARELYLALSAAERRRFDLDYTTLFFAHAATLPPINAEKILALMRAGILAVTKLGNNYRFIESPTGNSYEFVYGKGLCRTTTFSHVVDARGQERSVLSNRSRLIRNLVQSRMIHLGEVPENSEDAGKTTLPADETESHSAESVWIDPDSHRVMQVSRSGTPRRSRTLYAVGAMTRGQIIDVSMARALTKATDCIAKQIVDCLTGNRQKLRTESEDIPSPD